MKSNSVFCSEEAKNVRERKKKQCFGIFPGKWRICTMARHPSPQNKIITIKLYGPDNYSGPILSAAFVDVNRA